MDSTQDPRIERIQSLYDQGLFLQAWQTARPLGSLRQWPGTRGQVLAGRLASQLSADRLGDALILRAWRADPGDAEAVLYGAMALRSSRGVLASLDMLLESGVLERDHPLRWDATAYAASLYAAFRDFESAETLIGRALEASDTPWVWAQRAAIHEMADRYQDALEAARRAQRMNPRSRSAIQYLARFLSLFERDAEAIAVLREALATIESARVAAQLAMLEFEVGEFRPALATLDRFDALTPIKDKGTVSWLAGQRSDIHRRLGDLPRALEQARLSTSGFYRHVAGRLEQAAAGARHHMLPVGFVRQHHMTCAPATLSAISRYWGRPADHLDVAEAICYDGTPNHSQRRWAADNGWHVREFTATWDSARALLDAGIPFTLATVHPGSSHLQAAIGYDEARGTLLIRDPYERLHGEFSETPFFESYRSTGPRAMAMVPLQERDRLDAIDLPEAGLHDVCHALQDALEAHDRDRALARCAAIEAAAPGHRLAIGARRSLANYDGDTPLHLEATDALIALYPDDVNLRLSRADALGQIATRETALAYVRAQVQGPAAHPLFRLRLAQALLEDGRDHAEAHGILRKLVRVWNRAETLSALADANWQAGAYRRAVDLYRLAAAMEEMDESHSRTYFRAARMVRDEERALAFLHSRIGRLGGRSAQPWITLYDCLEELDRSREAEAALEDALAKHPEDGALLLFAARMASARGDCARADLHLQRARERSHAADWQRAAAGILRNRGDLAGALALWEQVAATAPLDLGAQRAIVALRQELEGRAPVVAYLRRLADAFPHHRGINELMVEWLDEEPLPLQEEALRRLLAIAPTNVWAQRQLAVVLAKQRRFAQALDCAEAARQMAPNSVAGHNVLGNVFFLEGRLEAAREEFRRALRLSVDNDYALNRLIEACPDLAARRLELDFVREQMKRQVIFGDSVLIYQQHARATIEPDALDAQLDEVRAARPDLWQPWVACLRQHVERQRLEQARALCEEAIVRFPLLPRMHVERADIARLAGDRAAEREALREALRLSPGWSLPARKLADSIEADGDYAASRALIETALRHSPGEAVLHGYLGHASWQLGEREAALASLERAADLDPGYEWAWRTLRERGAQAGRPDAAIALARRLAARSPGEVRAWLAVAHATSDDAEKLAALDQAIALSPLAIEAHEMKVDLLVAMKRFDEALVAAEGRAWGGRAPVALRARGARILAARADTAGAIARMRQVLDDDPNYAAGWELLADWHAEREEWPAYLEAARELCRVSPNDARALGYLSHALLRAQPDADVRPHLRRALQLKPDYAYAGYELFDLEFDAGELEAAERVLRSLSAHLDNGYLRLRGIRLAVQRGEHEQALDLFWKMWAIEDDEIEPFRGALGVLEKAGRVADAGRVIEGVALEPGVNPHVGTIWVERRAAGRFPIGRFRGFARVLANGAAGVRAAQAMLRHHAAKKNSRPLRRLLRRHGVAFRADPETHGLACYALVAANAPRAAVQWFGDWRAVADPQPWALLNLVSALRDLGRDAEAAEVGRLALSRPRDHTVGEHASWLAADAALAGDRAEAGRLLALADGEEFGAYYQFVGNIARGVIAAGAPGLPSRAEAFRRARQEFGRARALVPQFFQEDALRRLVWKGALRVGSTCSTHPMLAVPVGIYLFLVVI